MARRTTALAQVRLRVIALLGERFGWRIAGESVRALWNQIDTWLKQPSCLDDQRAVACIGSDKTVLIAVDGPCGPRLKAKDGAAFVARLSGRPVWCVMSTRLARPSSDGLGPLLIPFPFSP